ncbi:MAG: glucose-6-phosphate isomerase [Thermoleophilia bacterium]
MISWALGSHDAAVASAWRDAAASDLGGRIRAADGSAWREHAAGAAPWLGWLRAPSEMRAHVPMLEALAGECRRGGIRHAVLLGMGGSSLCPEVVARTFGAPAGIELRVLDSTDPATVARVGAGVDPAQAVYIVASKSGTTVEPLTFMAHFWDVAVAALGEAEAGRHFIAITDPGTPLAADARTRGFRAVLENPADIGGRYSALSLFGLLPMALAGAPVHAMLDGAAGALADDDAVNLGVALGTLGLAGRDKVTLLVDPPLSALGLWVEQLVAESLGKHGKGLVPVAEEPGGGPEDYGQDRVFVYHRMTGVLDQDVAALVAAGHPVATMDVAEPADLGAVFMAWEVATAAAGAVLDLNPFDQPDVQAAKDATVRVLGQIEAGEPPADERADAAAAAALMAGIKPGDYVTIQAFCPESPACDRAAADLRRVLRNKTGAAVTFGYGPRFLHSTGQLHKGGPETAVCFQLVSDDPTDLPVPGKPWSFGQLKAAQAIGDAAALADRGRRLVRVGIGSDAPSGISALARTLAHSPATTA